MWQVDGELQYVEKLPVDKPILCAAVSPCNSIILMASLKTFHVWREGQTSQSLHWVASNTGKFQDFSRMKGSKDNVDCKCCITSDSTKGVLALYFRGRDVMRTLHLQCYFILDDLNSKIKTRMIPCLDFIHGPISEFGEFYADSYCIVVARSCPWLAAVKLATGERVAEWVICRELRRFRVIVAHSKNDLVAVITEHPASVQFLKMNNFSLFT